ncbi:MAG: hypothetical protein QOD86_2490 [Miltoncostaeaceae bacterium]|nr:hypothetical protein [Miltoncostaeaceae bacterium]
MAVRRMAWLWVIAALLALAPAAHAERWEFGTNLPAPRTGGAAVALPDGRVLAIGGILLAGTGQATVDRYDPATKVWSPVHSMSGARGIPIVVRLNDGRVLVAGGAAVGDSGFAPMTTAELYDPATDTWTPAANAMSVARAAVDSSRPATVLPDGRVLLAGGAQLPSAAVDIFDPATNAFTPGAPMGHPRSLAGQTRLADGRVLVVGGVDVGGELATAEVYDPAAGTWTDVAGILTTPRAAPGLFALPNGRVLVVGGGEAPSFPVIAGTTATEVLDPATGQFAPAGTMSTPHNGGSAAQLPDGRVVVAGGTAASVNDPPSTAVDIFDPANGTWRVGPPLPSAVVLAAAAEVGGRVLLAGGAQGLNGVAITQVYVPDAPPGAPAAPTAVAGDGQATVTWSAPADTGDNPILRYTVTASTGQTLTTPDARTSVAVPGLANGTPVTFTVRATNVIGTGPASAPSAAVTPQAPGPPPPPPPPPADTTKPTLKVGGLKRVLSRAQLRKGIRLKITPNEPVKLSIKLLDRRVKPRRVTVTVGSKTAAGFALVRTLTIRPKAPRVRKAGRFNLRVQIVATDAAGNGRTVTRTILILG